jgi:ceramide glucosyltransferase
MRDLMDKRLRWIVVMRHMRPWGHFGLLFTQGLPWALIAIAIHPTPAVAAIYLGAYFAFRALITVAIGVWGLKQRGVFGKLPLIPLWDAAAFAIWVTSFARRSIRWRGADYYIRNGTLVPVSSTQPAGVTVPAR